jgi:hypothetical protein
MTTITTQEIAKYRSQLAEYQEALIALDAIEDCDGDLEDAAISLGIKVGQQPDRNDWLDGLAKRCRVAICQAELKADLANDNLVDTVANLIENEICPPTLATPVVIYALKQGIDRFCEPLDFKI